MTFRLSLSLRVHASDGPGLMESRGRRSKRPVDYVLAIRSSSELFGGRSASDLLPKYRIRLPASSAATADGGATDAGTLTSASRRRTAEGGAPPLPSRGQASDPGLTRPVPSPPGEADAGSTIRTVVPSPLRLSRSMVPPWAAPRSQPYARTIGPATRANCATWSSFSACCEKGDLRGFARSRHPGVHSGSNF